MKNSKLKITFDFDDVIADTSHAFLNILHTEYGHHDFDYEQWTNFKVVKCSTVPTQVVIDIFDRLFEDASIITPIKSSIEFLNSLDECIIVTARKNSEPVERWLLQNLTNSSIDLQVVTTGSHNKLEALKKIRPQFHVDDRFETYSDLVLNTNIVPIVYTKPWNEAYSVKNRIHQLDEVERIINDKTKNLKI